MKKEVKRQVEVYCQLFCVLIFAFLYSWAGCGHGLYLRRILGSLWFTAYIFYFSKCDWKALFIAPAMVFSLSLPYSGNHGIIISILLRMTYGATSALSGSMYLFIQKKWKIVLLHVFLVTSMMICMGSFGISFDARSEETILAVFIALIPMLGISRIKD